MYVAHLESLTDKQYADLAGAFLANGFIHLGFPHQARVRMLLELHFSKQIAESLEELPVLVLLRSIRESPANILRSNEDAKALFLHLRGDTCWSWTCKAISSCITRSPSARCPKRTLPAVPYYVIAIVRVR